MTSILTPMDSLIKQIQMLGKGCTIKAKTNVNATALLRQKQYANKSQWK